MRKVGVVKGKDQRPPKQSYPAYPAAAQLPPPRPTAQHAKYVTSGLKEYLRQDLTLIKKR